MDKKIKELEHLIQTEHSNIAGIVAQKDGEIAYERYFNEFSPNEPVHIASVVKSITSMLIGIAIDKGFIKNVEQKVLDFFPDYIPKRGEKTIQKVTIRHLLTMTAPYKYRSEPYTKVYSSDDWTKAALDLLGGRSGLTNEFKYSTVGTQILSGILVNATGQSVTDFATGNLFQPLGISTPPNTSVLDKQKHLSFMKDKHAGGWVTDPRGVNTAGWGLCLTPREMVKIGQLYLNNGSYNGRQIISSEWIAVSTKEKSRWDDLPYGYMWWIIEDKGSHCYAAIGDAGNILFIHPDKNIVVAITASFVARPVILTELITERIIPILE